MSNSAEWVTIAVLGKCRGNRGEVTAHSLSSKPERFAHLTAVNLFGSGEQFEVERIWDHQGTLVFKFKGIETISDAEMLRDAEVRVPAAQRIELESGEFFQSELIGCELRDEISSRLIGMVTGIEEYGGPTLLEIDDGRLLVPFVKAICTDIRPQDRSILARLPEGLETLANG